MGRFSAEAEGLNRSGGRDFLFLGSLVSEVSSSESGSSARFSHALATFQSSVIYKSVRNRC